MNVTGITNLSLKNTTKHSSRYPPIIMIINFFVLFSYDSSLSSYKFSSFLCVFLFVFLQLFNGRSFNKHWIKCYNSPSHHSTVLVCLTLTLRLNIQSFSYFFLFASKYPRLSLSCRAWDISTSVLSLQNLVPYLINDRSNLQTTEEECGLIMF